MKIWLYVEYDDSKIGYLIVIVLDVLDWKNITEFNGNRNLFLVIFGVTRIQNSFIDTKLQIL